jgi:hypothetical protein
MATPQEIFDEALAEVMRRFPDEEIKAVPGIPLWRKKFATLPEASGCLVSFSGIDIDVAICRSVPLDECDYDSAQLVMYAPIKPSIALESDSDWRRVAELDCLSNSNTKIGIKGDSVVAIRTVSYPLCAIAWHSLAAMLGHLAETHKLIISKMRSED